MIQFTTKSIFDCSRFVTSGEMPKAGVDAKRTRMFQKIVVLRQSRGLVIVQIDFLFS